MNKKSLLLLLIMLAAAVLASCSSLPFLDEMISSPTPPVDETLIPPTVEASPTPTPQNVSQLTIWVPPHFSPQDGTTAGNLFLSRLEEYANRRPLVDVKVRVKQLEGDYGLLTSLRSAREAAPLVMPDLIALPRPLMEQAYQEGLIIPLEERTGLMEDNNWFDFAGELSRIDDQLVGIPFAGDAIVLAYKINNSEEQPPVDWASLLEVQKALAFPASDPESLVTLAYYESLGGEFIPADGGNFQLQRPPLQDVLQFYQEAQAANVMPFWLTQLENETQAWSSYQERQSTLALTWSSLYFRADAPNTSLAAVPTRSGKSFTYATGWVWCVVSSQPAQEEEALELVEFLVEDGFLDSWSVESSYLPVRPSALEIWPEGAYPLLWQQILPAAVIPPDQEVINAIGMEVRDAVVAVLKDQTAPETALEGLIEEQ